MDLTEHVDISKVDGTDILVARTFNWTGHMIRGPWSQLDEIVSYLGEERTGLCICDASTPGAIELGLHGSNDIATKIQEQ